MPMCRRAVDHKHQKDIEKDSGQYSTLIPERGCGVRGLEFLNFDADSKSVQNQVQFRENSDQPQH